MAQAALTEQSVENLSDAVTSAFASLEAAHAVLIPQIENYLLLCRGAEDYENLLRTAAGRPTLHTSDSTFLLALVEAPLC